MKIRFYITKIHRVIKFWMKTLLPAPGGENGGEKGGGSECLLATCLLLLSVEFVEVDHD